jgi:LytR cell envelope-related transcriptional attenuator
VVDLIKEIGAFAGLGAFLGFAILALLYFSQARDVRRLRDWAGRAPERDAEGVEATSDLAAERAEEIRKIDEERRRREEASAAERQATTKREERRQRREAGLPAQTRWERVRDIFRGRPGGRRLPEPRYLAVVIGAVIMLGVGVAAAAGVFSGGGNGKGTKAGVVKPSQVEVAVLNGTNPPVQGLAGTVGNKLEGGGFRVGVVTNSRNSFTESVVMFTRGHKPEAAKVAKTLGIRKVRLMAADIRGDSAGAMVAVVVGQDKANFSG